VAINLRPRSRRGKAAARKTARDTHFFGWPRTVGATPRSAPREALIARNSSGKCGPRARRRLDTVGGTPRFAPIVFARVIAHATKVIVL
jgi:hypothetical protein